MSVLAQSRRIEKDKTGDAAEAKARSTYRENLQTASEIHSAITGLGTDEERLVRAVEGKSPEQMQEVARLYRHQFDSSMVEDIRKDLRGPFEGQASDEAAIKVGTALYGHKAMMLAGVLAGVNHLESLDGHGAETEATRKLVKSTITSYLDQLFEADPQLCTQMLRAYCGLFRDPRSGPNPFEVVEELDAKLLPLLPAKTTGKIK